MKTGEFISREDLIKYVATRIEKASFASMLAVAKIDDGEDISQTVQNIARVTANSIVNKIHQPVVTKIPS